MSNDLTKRSNDLTKRARPAASRPVEAASRLKRELIADSLGRMIDKDDEKSTAPGNPRVLLALANHASSPGWERAKILQREMFESAAGSLEMKFAFYAEDDEQGLRRFRITPRWITDPDDMAAIMGRATCDCGCF